MGHEDKDQHPESEPEAGVTRPGSTNLDTLVDQNQLQFQFTPQPGSTTNFDFDLAAEEGQQSQPLPEISEKQEDEEIRVLRGWILLNKGISRRNFYTSWLFVMYLGFILISFATIEPQFISKELGVSTESMGETTALLYLIDYSIRMLCALIFGPMIDYFGRKTVMTIGIILVTLGYTLIPFLSTSLFPGYIIGKAFISSGVIALSMLPFSADYVDNSTKGVMTGVNYGIGFVGGALCGILLKSLLLLGCSYRVIYWIYAPILLFVGFSLRPGIKGGNTYYKTAKPADIEGGEEEQKSKAIDWKAVKKAYKEIPWVPIAVIFGVLGNTDFYIMSTALMIWLKTLLPVSEDPTLIVTTYQVIFFGLSVITTIVCAMKIDKVPHMKMILPMITLAFLGFLIIPFTSDPKGVLLHIFFVIEGLSLPGVFVFSTYLSIRYNPSDIRGTLSAISNAVSFLAAIVILSVGGYLHDYWRSDASFILYGGLLFVTLFVVIVIFLRTRKYNVKPNDGEMIELARATRQT